jgi:hypothetical protein
MAPEPTFGLADLPHSSRHRVIANWRIGGMPMTRSIELVDGDYFLVARFLDELGSPIGGHHGEQKADS